MSKLKGVAVGVGYFSQFHYEAWSRIQDCRITAVCDLDIVKAKEVASKWDIQNTYDKFSEMLEHEKPDFVDIITPPDTHLELVKTAASQRVNVICQKPLAPSISEAQELEKVIANAGIQFMVHENFRFQPWYRKIKELLGDEKIGEEIYYSHFRMRMGDGWQDDAYLNRQPYFRKMPRLLIYETGIHFIDTFRYLFGEVEAVSAKLRRLNSNIAGEDWGLVDFDFKTGQTGVYDASRYNETNADDPRYTFGDFLIDGSKGSIRLDCEGNLFLQLLGESETTIDYQHGPKNFASDCVYETQKHFIECLKNAREFETSLPNYLPNLKIQEAIYQSAETNQKQIII